MLHKTIWLKSEKKFVEKWHRKHQRQSEGDGTENLPSVKPIIRHDLCKTAAQTEDGRYPLDHRKSAIKKTQTSTLDGDNQQVSRTGWTQNTTRTCDGQSDFKHVLFSESSCKYEHKNMFHLNVKKKTPVVNIYSSFLLDSFHTAGSRHTASGTKPGSLSSRSTPASRCRNAGRNLLLH